MNLGFSELVLILVIALLVFGPRKLPEIGKALGKGIAEFKRASNDLKQTVEAEIEEANRKDRDQTTSEPPAAVSAEADPKPGEKSG
jgi:TatA/E family protein of Tat protein translocase